MFFSHIEFCDNLIFRRRVALDKLGERLLDANPTIGQPNKITVIFDRKITMQSHGRLQTEIETRTCPTRWSAAIIATATNDVTDDGLN